MTDVTLELEHTEDSECWCCPVLFYKDPHTEIEVWVHNSIEEAN